MKRLFPVINVLSLFLLVILAAGAVYVESLIAKRLETETRATLQNHLYTVKNRIENNLLSDLQLAKGLVAAVATKPQLSQREFAQAAKSILYKHNQLLSVSAAPEMVLEMIYPLEGNEAALGLDLRKVPEQFIAAERAKKTGQVVLSGPVDLVEGGSAFIARMPVFIENPQGKKTFWGLVSALIDEKSLYINSQLIGADLPVEVAIRGRHALGEEGETFFGRADLFEGAAVFTELQLPVGSWQLAAIATGSLPEVGAFVWPMRIGYALSAFAILLSFFVMNIALKRTVSAQERAETAQSELQASLKSLNERETLLRTVIDEMPDVLVLKDHKGNFLLGNNTVARLYNTTPEEMVGKNDADFGVPQEMADFFRENVLAIMEKGEPEVVMEDSTDTASGEVRHFKSIKKPFKDADGNNQILVIAQDITEIVEAQRQLEISEKKFRTILDSVDAYIYLKDKVGHYLFANRKVRELWGAAMEDIVGFGDDKFFDHPTAKNIQHNDRLVLDDGQILKVEEVNTLPGGGTTTYQSTKLPLRSEDGDIYALCGISVDITELKNIEKALRISEQRFKIAGEAAYDLIYEWDVETDSLHWFGDIDDLLGYPKGSISQDISAWLNLIHPEDKDLLGDAVERHRTSTQPIKYEYRIQHKKGHYLYLSDHALPLLDENRRPYRWIGVCTDITTQKEQQLLLEFNAYHDKLTNLPNRVLLADRLSQAMHQQKRRGQTLAVVYIDLDGFKQINDQYGHDVGDVLLVEIGQRFQTLLREGDTIARLGGDEFVAVMLDINSSMDSIPLLRRILNAISVPVLVDDVVLQVSASLGVTFYPQAEDVDGDQLLRQADQAMYQAKLEGKNRYYFFDMEHDRSLRGQRETVERIELGLRQREFELYYQPKVNMHSGDVIGLEALIRWNHPEDGLLMPGQFLPVIEDKPVAIEIGEWVIEDALRQMDAWSFQGHDLSVSVNIGGLQLQQDNFVERLEALLKKFPRVASECLELEVLESSALQDIQLVSTVMQRCNELGVSFSLDDFGTGYSSLTYLKSLPAANLKIDRTFVRDMLDDPDDLAILEGVVGMSTAFRRGVIAEGVEEIAHGEMLLKLGCNLAQGFAIAKPMKAALIPDWISRWHPPKEWQEQGPISRDDISLLFAEIEHRAWLHKVDRFVAAEEPEELDPPEFDVSKCRFGSWLDKHGREQYGEAKAFINLDDLHEKVHVSGELACKAALKGDVEAIKKHQTDLHKYSNDLLNVLMLILQEQNPG